MLPQVATAALVTRNERASPRSYRAGYVYLQDDQMLVRTTAAGEGHGAGRGAAASSLLRCSEGTMIILLVSCALRCLRWHCHDIFMPLSCPRLCDRAAGAGRWAPPRHRQTA